MLFILNNVNYNYTVYGEYLRMSMLFADTLKKLRIEKGLTQLDLAEQLFVSRTSVNRWENGTRLPDAMMIVRLSEALGVGLNVLFNAAAESDGCPNVIMLDDNKIVLNGGMKVLEEVMPNAAVTGFTKPAEAIEFARHNQIALAFLDIEMGSVSGLDVCRELLSIFPRTNVIYLTAYPSYSLDAWETGACGFMLKPITAADVKKRLKNLRFPLLLGGTEEW